MTYIVIFMLLLMIGRLLSSIVHELGHAVAAILLTGQKAVVYIGSYGDPGNSLHLKSRKLEMFFRYNPLAWTGGLCVSEAKEISIARQVIFTLAGPIASLLIAVPAVYVIFAYDLNDAWKVAAIVFFIAAMLDLSNLIPRKTPIKLFDGSITYNDGYTLWQLFSSRSHIKGYQKGVHLFNSGDFRNAAELFENIIASGMAGPAVYRGAASALNNQGYYLNLSGKFEEAIVCLDKALKYDEKFAFAYNNRGLEKIKTRNMEDGLKDVSYSLELDPGNGYGYRNLGIYHFDRGEYREALELFKKAKDLEPTTDMIDELISDTEKQLNTFK